MNIDVGTTIAGKYELVRLLGKGAMGEVWLATHNSLGGEFAIKLVEPATDAEAETAAGRFQLEAQIAAKLSRRTRHIVSVSDYGEENGLAYLVMERLEGESLEARMRDKGPMSVAQIAAIVAQVARALSLAHEEGIFHRDLKPANIWLGRDEDGQLLVKLLDFGIARTKKPFRTRSPFMTSKDMVLGTPSYMSPEQARGLETLDYRCDIWALAVVAYEALATKIPFEGTTVEDIFLSICTFRVVPVRARRPELPPELDAIFAKSFASNLADRYSNAEDLAASFEALVSPEALAEAMGLSPGSGARGLRRSQSNLEAAAASASMLSASSKNPRTNASTDAAVVAPVDPRASSPEFTSGMMDEFGAIVLRRRSPTAKLLAVAIAICVLGIGVLAFVSLRRPKNDFEPSLSPPPAVTTLSGGPESSARSVPPPPDPVQVDAPKSSTPPSSAPPSNPQGRTQKAARPTAPGTPGTATPTRTPPPSKTVNKAEVF